MPLLALLPRHTIVHQGLAVRAQHGEHLAAAHNTHAIVLAEAELLGIERLRAPLVSLQVHQEHHVVRPQRVPLAPDHVAEPRERERDLGHDAGRARLAQERLAELCDGKAVDRDGHTRPAAKLGEARGRHARRKAAHNVLQVLANLIVGLGAEQIKVAQEVVVKREELEVELGECKGSVAAVVLAIILGIPENILK